MNGSKIRSMVFIALFAAIIAVFSQLIIPLPSGIPVTLQTFAVALSGYCLGSFRGMTAVLVYIAVGLAGAPVFTGFRGGFAALFDLTGGFIVGFVPLALLCGISSGKGVRSILCGIAGILACHLCGILWFSLYTGNISSAFMTASLPYIPKDLISAAAAASVSVKIRRIIQKFN